MDPTSSTSTDASTPPTAVPASSAVDKMQLALSGAQGLGIWVVAFLLLVQIFMQSGTNSRLVAVEESINDLGYKLVLIDAQVSALGNADVFQLQAVKMRGSETWTLPVSSISWSGR